MSGISKSQVSRLCEEINDKVKAFLERPVEGDWPYFWIDATYLKVRRDGRIVSAGANTDRRREARRNVPIVHWASPRRTQVNSPSDECVVATVRQLNAERRSRDVRQRVESTGAVRF